MNSFARIVPISAFALLAGWAMIATFAATAPAAAATPVVYAGPANPTGLPTYEMRPDGLMINGLLPANGWEG
jgi:hypothetical protein